MKIPDLPGIDEEGTIMMVMIAILILLIAWRNAEASTVSVSLTIPCTLDNYLTSNCVPPELLKMPIEMCYDI